MFGVGKSGLAAAEILKSHGAQIFLSESESMSRFSDSVGALLRLGADSEFGGHTDKAYETDFAVLSPGIPEHAPIMRELSDRHIPVYSELEIASWYCGGRIIAVTGSNGKTTSTTLLGEMLTRAFDDVRVGGNIGTPFSELLKESHNPDTIFVLEVSSFQLRWIDKFHPGSAAVLNVSVDHLDWHRDMDAYVDAKKRIYENMTDSDFFVYNADDEITSAMATSTSSKALPFSIDSELEEGCFVSGDSLLLRYDGEERVLRGGAWDSSDDICRSSYRAGDAAINDTCLASDTIGFRCVKSVQ